MENLSFEQKQPLVDLLIESIEVTTVSSQLNLNIKLRFDQSKVLENEAVGEPKKSSTEPQSGTEELNIDDYGAQMTAHTRTAIKEFVENYDRVKEKYINAI